MNRGKIYYWFFAFLSAILSFIIYFLTTNRHLTFTDNGELMAVCRTLGVAHPTGYPLFTILGHLWSLLPISENKIFQMNLFSAFLTGASVLLFYLASIELFQIMQKSIQIRFVKKTETNLIFRTYVIAFISALIYSFGSVIWSQATSLEVYSLQLFLFNLLFHLIFLLVTKNFRNGHISLLALTLGLSFANHLTTILFVPVILFIFLFDFEKRIRLNFKKLRILLSAFPFFVLGFSLYVYLPIRSSQLPIFNWGWVHRSFEKFWYHFSGKQYRIWMFSSLDNIGINFEKFVNSLVGQFHYFGLLIVLIGILYLSIKNKLIFWLLIITILSNLVYSLNYQIHDIETYFSLSIISMAFFFGVGVYFTFVKFNNYYLLTSIIPVLLILRNYNINDESHQKLVENYTQTLVDNLEPNAIIISAQWDYFCSPFWYLQQVEGYRPDVVLIEKELLRRTWYLKQLQQWYPEIISNSRLEIENFLNQLELFESEKNYDPTIVQSRYIELLSSFVEKNIEKRPIYVTFDILSNSYDAIFLRDYFQRPVGFAIKIEQIQKRVPLDLAKIPLEKFVFNHSKAKNHLVKGILESIRINFFNLYRYSIQIRDTISAKKLSEAINLLANTE